MVAESKLYADELKAQINSYGLEISELSTHLQGQLIAVNPAFNQMFDNFAPKEVHGKSKDRQLWATQHLKWAAKASENGTTTPRFLYKAGQMAYTLGKKEAAHKYFSEIKDKYDTSVEGRNIDGLIEMTRP